MKKIFNAKFLKQNQSQTKEKFFAFYLKTKNYKLKTESGMTLVFSVIILSNILIIALAIGLFSMSQFQIASSAKDSAYAIFAGTSGLEKVLYETRVVSPFDYSMKTDLLLTNPKTTYSTSVVCRDFGGTIVDCSLGGFAEITTMSNGKHSQTTRKIEAKWMP